MATLDPLLTRARTGGVADALGLLLAHRQAQHGRFTPGDAVDAAFLAFLRDVRPDAGLVPALDAAGEVMGRAVHAKLFVDEPLPRALDALAARLHGAGLGRVHVEDAFHRAALLRHDLGDAPAAAAPLVVGALRGYLAECYNCEATAARRDDGRIEVALGSGRDVNRGSSA